MVLVKAKRDELLEPLSSVSGIIERRHTLPILSNVLLERSGGELRFVATDIEIQITARMALAGSGDDQSITVGARKLVDILRALPEDADVTLQMQDKRLQVKAGRSRFALQTLAADDFPKLAPASGDEARFSVSQKLLRKHIAMVSYAMAQQDIRYYLNGLLMLVDGASLRLVATDGHRLAYAEMTLEAALEKRDVIVPRKTIIELGKLLQDTDDEVNVALSGNQASFNFGGVTLVSKLVDGKFPDYTRVIPDHPANRLETERDTLRHALQRAAILSNEKFRGVRWVLTDDTLKIVSSNAEQEEAQEEIEVRYQGDAIDIGFNVNYVLDVLNNMSGATVSCRFGDSASSALIEFADEPQFKYVVMPMRI